MDAGAASNTSLIALTPENIKYTNFSREPEDGLAHVLASNTTLNALRLTFNDDANMRNSWALLLGNGLARNTSLKNLTLAITVHKRISYLWLGYNDVMRNICRKSLGSGLKHNTSLKNLTLIIENHSNVLEHEPCIDWARKTSVENLFLTVNNHSLVRRANLDRVFASKKSLKNLTLTINNFGELNLDWEDNGLENKSLNDFSLTINNYGNLSGVSGIRGSLSRLKSLTTLNLTLNLCGKGGKEILPCLLEKAMEIESLKTQIKSQRFTKCKWQLWIRLQQICGNVSITFAHRSDCQLLRRGGKLKRVKHGT